MEAPLVDPATGEDLGMQQRQGPAQAIAPFSGKRHPGEDGEIDLVRIEAIAAANGQRLPEFPIDLHVGPTAGADPIRKLSAKSDHEGRITHVVRVPAGAEVVVRAMPGSIEEAACQVSLDSAADVAESRRFALAATLPVRGKSRLEPGHTKPTDAP